MKTIVLLTMINHDYRSLVAEQGRWSKCFECGVSPFNEDDVAQIELDICTTTLIRLRRAAQKRLSFYLMGNQLKGRAVGC